MGKVLKIVAGVALIAAAIVLAPVIGPVFAAQLASVGVSLVATGIAGILAPKPSAEKPPPLNFRQAIANSFILIGKRRQGGLMIFFHPRTGEAGGFLGGPDRHWRYFIFAAAGHRCKGVTRWYLNDEIVTVDGSGMVTSGTYANAAWLWFGRGSYTTDETPANFRSETEGRWSNNHVGYGVAKIFAKFEMTEEVVQAGMPTISAEIEGTDEIRDPRDGSVGYTDLAIPAFYWWMQLPREEGGFGAAADEIPEDALLSAWTNICDEDVALLGGGTEKRYTFDSRIETGAPPSQIRQTFVECMAGTFTYSEGKFLMRPGYWTPPSMTLQEEDLAGEITLDAFLQGDEVATEVAGTYVDPDTLYQPQAIATRSVASVDVRQVNFDLAHITSHTRGQRILEIMLRRAQCEKRVQWPMNIVGLETRAMQTVQLATTRYGLSNYAFVIDGWGLNPSFDVELSLREENSEIYDWQASDELDRLVPAAPAIAAPVPTTAATAGSAGSATTAGSAGQVSDSGITYTASQIQALEDRIAALETP